MKFEIVRGQSSWWWRIVARNNKILAHSEQYTSRQGAKEAIKAVKKGAAGAKVEVIG